MSLSMAMMKFHLYDRFDLIFHWSYFFILFFGEAILNLFN